MVHWTENASKWFTATFVMVSNICENTKMLATAYDAVCRFSVQSNLIKRFFYLVNYQTVSIIIAIIMRTKCPTVSLTVVLPNKQTKNDVLYLQNIHQVLFTLKPTRSSLKHSLQHQINIPNVIAVICLLKSEAVVHYIVAELVTANCKTSNVILLEKHRPHPHQNC